MAIGEHLRRIENSIESKRSAKSGSVSLVLESAKGFQLIFCLPFVSFSKDLIERTEFTNIAIP